MTIPARAAKELVQVFIKYVPFDDIPMFIDELISVNGINSTFKLVLTDIRTMFVNKYLAQNKDTTDKP